jgi:hypothetical protein
MKINYCKNCGLLVNATKGPTCKRTGVLIQDPQSYYCPNFRITDLNTCDICGNYILDGSEIIDEQHIICPDCFSRLNTCITCITFESNCDFQSNPINIPPMVTKEVRKGPMVSMCSVQNPERVEKTCKVNCHCYHDEVGCLRQAQHFVCDNYKTNYRK